MRNLKSRLRAIGNTKPERPEAPPISNCLRRNARVALPEPCCPEDMFRALLGVEACPLENALYIDTETTGLSGGAGTLAFLTGVGRFEDGEFVLEQYFLRDYGEEIYMLEALEKLLDEASCLVSFNGKSFDIPLLRTRFTMQRLRWRWDELPHIDLLHAARRVWKPRLERLRLVDLEAELLGIEREGDIPGRDIPDLYFHYLDNRIWQPMEQVLRHNALDIQNMPRLLDKIARSWENPMDPLDAYSIGRAHARAKDHAASLRYFRIADVPGLRERSRVSLAEALRHADDQQAYIEENRAMISQRVGGMYPYIALAKYYEHQAKDIGEALRITDEALARCTDSRLTEALLHRRRRLARKRQ